MYHTRAATGQRNLVRILRYLEVEMSRNVAATPPVKQQRRRCQIYRKPQHFKTFEAHCEQESRYVHTRQGRNIEGSAWNLHSSSKRNKKPGPCRDGKNKVKQGIKPGEKEC